MANDSDLSALKTAFIIKMVNFIDWPEKNLNEDHIYFNFCVKRSSRVSVEMLDWARTAELKSRPVKIINVYFHPERRKQCDLIFIQHSSQLSKELATANQYGILTISDIYGTARQGVIINFYQEGDNLRFEINLKKARELNFSIQPRLLKLARIVE